LGVAIYLSVVLLLPGFAIAERDRVRRVTVDPFDFRIDVPATWQLHLNERLRDKAFLKIQGTTRDGQLIPASLSVIYSQPEFGQSYPQLPEPETYAGLFQLHPENAQEGYEFLRAEKCSIDGYAGVLVEYKQVIGEHPQRIVQMNVVPPDGSKRFIVTYGSFEEHADVDMPYLKSIVDTIRLTSPQQNEPEG